MAIFKKLNIGDAVATSGTRSFRKLTTEDPTLPVWDGVDLTGTTWTIKSGWSAEAGYGEFDVNGKQCVLTGVAVRFNYYSLCVGYAVANSVGTPYTSANSLCWNGGLETTVYGSITDTTKELEFSFTGGADTTNTDLINWLLENAELTSHTMPEPGLPIWNGTDLTGTEWFIPAGWTAEVEYGVFDVQIYRSLWPGDKFHIGYYGYSPEADCVTIVGPSVVQPHYNHSQIILNISGGTDVTNPRLIDWLLQNAELTSHQYPIKGFWRLNDTITKLPDEYIDADRINIEFQDMYKVKSAIQILTGLNFDGGGEVLAYDITAIYGFTKKIWSNEGYRDVAFLSSSATNKAGEDVTAFFYKWLTTNATKQGQITFTISGKTYKADNWMHWSQWVGSKYNTDGYTPAAGINVTYINDKNGNGVYANGEPLDKTDLIIAGYDYVLA